MDFKKHAIKFAAENGLQIFKDGTDLHIDCPRGKCFDEGLHMLVCSGWKDALYRIKAEGVEVCDDPECDYCTDPDPEMTPDEYAAWMKWELIYPLPVDASKSNNIAPMKKKKDTSEKIYSTKEIRSHVYFLTTTLIPDMVKFGRDSTAGDLQTCVGMINQLSTGINLEEKIKDKIEYLRAEIQSEEQQLKKAFENSGKDAIDGISDTIITISKRIENRLAELAALEMILL